MTRRIVTFFLLLFPELAWGQATQFYLEDQLNEQLRVSIYVVGEAAQKAQIQESLYSSVDLARESLKKLNEEDASSEIAAINQNTKGSFLASKEVAEAISEGLRVNAMTHGGADVLSSYSPKQKVRVDLKNNTVKRQEDVQIRLKPILKGLVADLIAKNLENGGWKNVLVKIGSVYVSKGSDANGPWKLPAVVPSNKSAKRVLYFRTKQDAASATVSAPKSEEASSDLSSVTIFAPLGVEAEGLARAAYSLGLEEAKKLIAEYKGLRTMMVDKTGTITHIPKE